MRQCPSIIFGLNYLHKPLEVLLAVATEDAGGLGIVERLPFKVAKHTARLFQNQGGSSKVPRREHELEVEFAVPQCEVAKLGCCRAEAADVVAQKECLEDNLRADACVLLTIDGEGSTHD